MDADTCFLVSFITKGEVCVFKLREQPSFLIQRMASLIMEVPSKYNGRSVIKDRWGLVLPILTNYTTEENVLRYVNELMQASTTT